MLKRFIDATVRKNVWTLFDNRNTVSNRWIINGINVDSYDDEEYLHLQEYHVNKKIFEIITKILVLSTIKLSKDEIFQNLKKRYNEDEINKAISFLKNNGIIKEYFAIPHKNEVIMRIEPRDICYKNKESKKFYTAEFYYNQDTTRIISKNPRERYEHIHCLHISKEPLCFEKVPKDKWYVDLLSIDSLRQQIHKDIVNHFMSDTCVIENKLRLGLQQGSKTKAHCDFVPDEEVINHKDREKAKKELLKRWVKKIKLFGGKNIVVKEINPLEVNIKYIHYKEIILSMAIAYCAGYVFPPFKEIMREKNSKNIWTLHVRDDAIRKRKKEERDDYFFIDDENEDFDDIVIGNEIGSEPIYMFPRDFETNFMDYVTKRFKNVGVDIKVIHEKFFDMDAVDISAICKGLQTDSQN